MVSAAGALLPMVPPLSFRDPWDPSLSHEGTTEEMLTAFHRPREEVKVTALEGGNGESPWYSLPRY